MSERDVQAELDAALLENARLRRLAESRKERLLAAVAAQDHNHMTRDVKPIGECPGCDTRARLLAEIERLRADGESWFDAYNELRDKGDLSWDMFYTTLGAAMEPFEQLRIALSNYMDKPWAMDDWWTPVRDAFYALSPDWPQGEDHFTDPYQLGKLHGHLEEKAGTWTAEELEEIQERARVRAAELRELAD